MKTEGHLNENKSKEGHLKGKESGNGVQFYDDDPVTRGLLSGSCWGPRAIGLGPEACGKKVKEKCSQTDMESLEHGIRWGRTFSPWQQSNIRAG